MGVAPDKLMGWWRRKAHVVANAVLGSLTGMTVGAAVAKTGLGGWAVGALGLGAGTMSALAVPIVITAGLAIPAVHYLRKALGQQEMDRRAQAGRVADKLQKKITKAERSAGNEWFSAGPFNQARLEAEAERLAKKPAWGAIAGSLATGMLTGAISYDIHTGGRLTAAAWENVPTRAQAGGWFSGAWQGITSLFSGALSSQPADPLGLAPSLTQCASAFEVRTIVQETMREGLRPLIAAVSDLGDAIDTLSSTTAGIQDRLQDLTRDIGILERSVQLLGGDMQRFSGQMGDLQRQIADLSQSVRGLRVPGIANDALTALTTRVDALEAAVLQGAQSAPPLRPPLAPPLWAPLPETLLSPDIFSQTSGSRGTWGMLENIFHTAGVDPADIGRQFNLNQSDSRFVMSLLIDAHDGIFEPGRAAYDPNIAREILGVDSARRIGPSGREVDWTAFFDRTDVRDSIEQRIEAGLKRRFNENLGGRIFSYLSDRLDLIYKSAAQ